MTDVLVVDDDATMADSIVEILELHGLAATAATNATLAVVRQRRLRPAVVICDQRLPDMSGLDVCAAIRENDPDVSLILLTGHASLDSAIAAVGLIDTYLTKPVPPDTLIQTVTAAAARASQRRGEREQAEQAAVRQRQASQIDDSIVQYLVLAQARLEVGDFPGAAAAIDEGLTRARGLIDELISVPAVDAADPPPEPVTAPAVHRGVVTVVIADDSADLRQLIRMLLELEAEFAVVAEAGNGHEAIRAAASHRPDLLLLDHAMPDLDGLTALPRIREVSPDTTVVMLSGFSANRLADAAVAHGATAYITKANLATELLPELQRIMRTENASQTG